MVKTVQKNRLSLAFKAVFIILCALGIILNFSDFDSPVMMTLSYYTIQSNIACLILMGVWFIREWRGLTPSKRLNQIKGGFTVMIFLTFIVYHVLLRPVLRDYNIDYDGSNVSNILVHYVSPLLMVCDHFLFDPKPLFQKADPFRFLIIPVLYWIYTLIYAAFGGLFIIGTAVSKYPYFFLDFENQGFFTVMLWVTAIVILYLLIGFGFVLADKWTLLAKKRINKNAKD